MSTLVSARLLARVLENTQSAASELVSYTRLAVRAGWTTFRALNCTRRRVRAGAGAGGVPLAAASAAAAAAAGGASARDAPPASAQSAPPRAAAAAAETVEAARANSRLAQLKGPIVNLRRVAEPFIRPVSLQRQLERPSEAHRLLVFVAKRPLQCERWSSLLVKLRIEHVGVMVMSVGAAAAALQQQQQQQQQRLPRVTYDYLPLAGDFTKFGGRVPAKVQRNKLNPTDWALVGWSDKTQQQLREYNASYDRVYMLAENDCRDYASRASHFLCAEHISPGVISQYINDSATRNLSAEQLFQLVRSEL